MEFLRSSFAKASRSVKLFINMFGNLATRKIKHTKGNVKNKALTGFYCKTLKSSIV